MGNTRQALFLIAVSTLIAMMICSLPVSPYLRTPFAFLLVLYLPGASVAATFFSDLHKTIKGLIAVMTSVAFTIIIGLLLNLVSALFVAGWILALGCVTLIICAVGIIKGSLWTRVPALHFTLQSVRAKKVVPVCAAFIIVVAAVFVARTGAVEQREFAFTQLWAVKVDKTRPTIAEIGIQNNENRQVSYGLTLSRGGRQIGSWGPIDLQPNEQWTTRIDTKPRSEQNEKLEVRLYKTDAPETLYRKVSLATTGTLPFNLSD